MSRDFSCAACLAPLEAQYDCCPSCGVWGRVVAAEKAAAARDPEAAAASAAAPKIYQLAAKGDEAIADVPRVACGIDQVDAFFNGGLAAGQVVLLSGDPGAGKSTLCLQLAIGLAQSEHVARVLIATGEEIPAQVLGRARRLGVPVPEGVSLIATNELEHVLAAAEQLAPRVIILDSMQVFTSSEATGAPASVSQVQACGRLLTNFCKRTEAIGILICQILKDGDLAGPKTLEHLVDTTVHLELELEHAQRRTLSARKNRYGPCTKTVHFEMRENGLAPIGGRQ